MIHGVACQLLRIDRLLLVLHHGHWHLPLRDLGRLLITDTVFYDLSNLLTIGRAYHSDSTD